MGGNQQSLPMTYMHEGRQFIVFAAGGGGQSPRLVAWALSGEDD
jgi:hypothetical protein